jgi:mutator protein MutT
MEAVYISIALIIQKGCLLIAKRKADSHLGHLWEFPGGKRLPGETSRTCLLREVKEELDIDIHIVSPLGQFEHAYPDRTVMLSAYLCRPVGGRPTPLASEALRWVDPNDLSSFSFP